MPDVLTLRWLGKPQVSLSGAAVAGFISAKAQALLFYLAVRAGASSARTDMREALAGLLWGEMPEAHASKNLRNALSNLRARVGPHLLFTSVTQ